jgi:predicted XRE-type DNA-binding protein
VPYWGGAERREPVTRGTGNVFADLGFPDAAERQAKLHLAYALNQVLDGRTLSQADAAKVLGVTQPTVSALRHYKLAGFSDADGFAVYSSLPTSNKHAQLATAADSAAPWTSSHPCDTERRPFGSGTRGRPRPGTDTTTLKSHESPSTGHCICATRCSCGPSKESILRSKSDSRCYGCNSSAGRRGRKQLEKKRNTGNAFPMVVAARRGLKRH